jgi:hypothetical protein
MVFFPPAAVVRAMAPELSEGALVAGVTVDVAVAIDHPTQDNWVTVGGDALAIATAYVVGKVLAGTIVRGVRGLVGREIGTEASTGLPKTRQAVEQVIHRAGTAADDKLAAEAAAQQAATRAVAREARQASLARDPQTGEMNPKSISEAESIMQAEDKKIVIDAERPNLTKGEPNLDFKIKGPEPYRYCDVKTPIEPGRFPKTSITDQAGKIARNIKTQKAGSSDVLHIVDLKNVPSADRAVFKAEVLNRLDSEQGVQFIND